MAQGFEVTDQDRQQVKGVFQDPSFYKLPPDQQRQRVSQIPVMQRLGGPQRDRVLGLLMRNTDKIRLRLGVQDAPPPTPNQGDPSRPSPLVTGIESTWNAATIPVSERVLGKGHNISTWNRQAETNQGTRAPYTNREMAPWEQGVVRAENAVYDDLGGMADFFLSPAGIASLGFATKGKAAAGALAKVRNVVSNISRVGFSGLQAKSAVDSLRAAFNDPSVESVTHAFTQAALAGVITIPEWRAITKGVKRFTGKSKANGTPMPEPEIDDHAAFAKNLSTSDLASRTHELNGKVTQLQAARSFNEKAGSALGVSEKKLQALRDQRDQVAFSLEDTAELDKQINSMEERLKKVRDKVAENHQTIEDLRSENVEEHHGIYSKALREREAPPTATGSKKYPAPSTNQQPGYKSWKRTLPAGPAQAQLPAAPGSQPGARPPFISTEPQPSAQPRSVQGQLPPSSIKPRDARGGLTMPGQKQPAVEFTPQLEAGPEPTTFAQIEQRDIKGQLPAAPTRTPDGAVISPEATQQWKKPKGLVASGKPPQAPTSRQLPPARTPHAIAVERENGRDIQVIQGKEPQRSAAPPVAKQPVQSKDVTPERKPVQPPIAKKTEAPPKPADKTADIPGKPEGTAQPAKPIEGKAEAQPKPVDKTPDKPADIAGGDKANTLQEGKVTELHPNDIHTDPPRFQYKGKAIGKGGTSDEMRDVEEFDPEKAGVLSVWKDPANKKTFVVNGHHRLERAKSLGYDKPLPVRYLDAKTPAEARTKGALINIAEGRGEPLDAAKVFREGGIKPEDLKKYGISKNGPIAKQGISLSKLSDPVFEDVATGKLPEGRGVVIGELLDDPADQEAAAQLSRSIEAKGKKITDSEFRETIGFIKSAPKGTVDDAQGGLFGEANVEKNLYAEKGEVSDFVRSQLATDKRLFGMVGRQAVATKLGEAGNTIKVDENAARAQSAAQVGEIYDRLKNSSGPIANILDGAAKELAEGGKPGDVKARAYQRIQDQLARDLSQIHGGGKSGNGSGVPASVEGGSNPPSAGVSGQGNGRVKSSAPPPAPQQSLSNAREVSDFASKNQSSVEKERMQAELKSPKFQGDPGRSMQSESPLFGGKPIDTGPPQSDMFVMHPDSAKLFEEKPTKSAPVPPKVQARQDYSAGIARLNGDGTNSVQTLRRVAEQGKASGIAEADLINALSDKAGISKEKARSIVSGQPVTEPPPAPKKPKK